MLPLLDLLCDVMTMAACAYTHTCSEETEGYASRTLSYYSIAPLVQIDRQGLIADAVYFLGLQEEVQLTGRTKPGAVSLTGVEAFNDLLNEAAMYSAYPPGAFVRLRELCSQAICLGEDQEISSFLDDLLEDS